MTPPRSASGAMRASSSYFSWGRIMLGIPVLAEAAWNTLSIWVKRGKSAPRARGLCRTQLSLIVCQVSGSISQRVKSLAGSNESRVGTIGEQKTIGGRLEETGASRKNIPRWLVGCSRLFCKGDAKKKEEECQRSRQSHVLIIVRYDSGVNDRLSESWSTRGVMVYCEQS